MYTKVEFLELYIQYSPLATYDFLLWKNNRLNMDNYHQIRYIKYVKIKIRSLHMFLSLSLFLIKMSYEYIHSAHE